MRGSGATPASRAPLRAVVQETTGSVSAVAVASGCLLTLVLPELHRKRAMIGAELRRPGNVAASRADDFTTSAGRAPNATAVWTTRAERRITPASRCWKRLRQPYAWHKRWRWPRSICRVAGSGADRMRHPTMTCRTDKAEHACPLGAIDRWRQNDSPEAAVGGCESGRSTDSQPGHATVADPSGTHRARSHRASPAPCCGPASAREPPECRADRLQRPATTR